MFAKANNDKKFIFIGGIATKKYFIGHYWFIFGHYCSRNHYCRVVTNKFRGGASLSAGISGVCREKKMSYWEKKIPCREKKNAVSGFTKKNRPIFCRKSRDFF